MIVGVIQTKDILLNPITLIRMKGLVGYLKLILRSLSSQPHCFINMIENTEWIKTEDLKK
ncbi:MAG: hypothetical protein IPJ69_11465 [Deltaproteobacteria bacterium]|nr:MAG: hypothetical protein IPJ69_11465 [Deltaproteobacteria bacterium]